MGEFDVCTLFYARFKSVISQIPTAQQLIPAELGAREETGPVYYYEPDEGEILTQLLPRAVTVRIYRAQQYVASRYTYINTTGINWM